MKIIHITDTHLVAKGQRLYGLDPYDRLLAAVANINAHHADAELAVFTGDLTHWGDVEAYKAFHSCAAKLSMPFVPMVGNHDRRVRCLSVLAGAPCDPNGFVQGWKETVAGRLVFLDTLDETTHAGAMCGARLVHSSHAARRGGKEPTPADRRSARRLGCTPEGAHLLVSESR